MHCIYNIVPFSRVANPVKTVTSDERSTPTATVTSKSKVVKSQSGKKKLSSTSSDEQQGSRSRKYASLDQQQLSTSPDADGKIACINTFMSLVH